MANKLFALVLVGVGGAAILYAKSQQGPKPVTAKTPAGTITINPANYTTTNNSNGTTTITDNTGLGQSVTVPSGPTSNTATNTNSDIQDYTAGAVTLRIISSDWLAQTLNFAVNVNGAEIYNSVWGYGDQAYSWTGPNNVIALVSNTPGVVTITVYDSTGVNVLLSQDVSEPAYL